MNQIVHFPVVYIQDPVDMGYTAYITGVDGAIADGDTKEEAHANLYEVISILTEERQLLNEAKIAAGPSNGISAGHLDMTVAWPVLNLWIIF